MAKFTKEQREAACRLYSEMNTGGSKFKDVYAALKGLEEFKDSELPAESTFQSWIKKAKTKEAAIVAETIEQKEEAEFDAETTTTDSLETETQEAVEADQESEKSTTTSRAYMSVLDESEKRLNDYLLDPNTPRSRSVLKEIISGLKDYVSQIKEQVKASEEKIQAIMSEAREGAKEELESIMADLDQILRNENERIDNWRKSPEDSEQEESQTEEDKKRQKYADKVKAQERKEAIKRITAFKGKIQKAFEKAGVSKGDIDFDKLREIREEVEAFKSDFEGFSQENIDTEALFDGIISKYDSLLSVVESQNEQAKKDIRDWTGDHALRKMIEKHSAKGLDKVAGKERRTLFKMFWKEFKRTKKEPEYEGEEIGPETIKTMVSKMRDTIYDITGIAPDRFEEWGLEELEPQDDIIIRTGDNIAQKVQDGKEFIKGVGTGVVDAARVTRTAIQENGPKVIETVGTIKDRARKIVEDARSIDFAQIVDRIHTGAIERIESFREKVNSSPELATAGVNIGTMGSTETAPKRVSRFGEEVELPQISEEEKGAITEVNSNSVLSKYLSKVGHFLQSVKQAPSKVISSIRSMLVKQDNDVEQDRENGKDDQGEEK